MTRDLPPSLSDFLDPDEEAKPIRGFPQYFITSDARVISMKGRNPRTLSIGTQGGSDDAVRLSKDGSRYTRSVKRLWAEAFAETKAPVWETYQYLTEEYDDPRVHEWAEETLKPMCGSDGIGKHRDSRYLDYPKK